MVELGLGQTKVHGSEQIRSASHQLHKEGDSESHRGAGPALRRDGQPIPLQGPPYVLLQPADAQPRPPPAPCTAACLNFLHYPPSWLYRVAPELMPHVSAVEQERANLGPSSCPAFYSQRVTTKDSK
ncbi:uncharacterized protein LOC144239382 [Crocuta crocuta]